MNTERYMSHKDLVSSVSEPSLLVVSEVKNRREEKNLIFMQEEELCEALEVMSDYYAEAGKEKKCEKYLGYLEEAVITVVKSMEETGRLDGEMLGQVCEDLDEKIEEVSKYSQGKNQSYLKSLVALREYMGVARDERFKKSTYGYLEESLVEVRKVIRGEEEMLEAKFAAEMEEQRLALESDEEVDELVFVGDGEFVPKSVAEEEDLPVLSLDDLLGGLKL